MKKNNLIRVLHLSNKIYTLVLIFFILLFPNLVNAEIKNLKIQPNKINTLVDEQVKESFTYSGLASFYNNVSAYIISNDKIKKIDDKNLFILKSNQSLALIGHHKILIINNFKAPFVFEESKLISAFMSL